MTFSQLYMRNVNNATGIKEVQDSGARRGKTSPSPSFEAAGLGRAVAHEPLSSQMWGRSYSRESAVSGTADLEDFMVLYTSTHVNSQHRFSIYISVENTEPTVIFSLYALARGKWLMSLVEDDLFV